MLTPNDKYVSVSYIIFVTTFTVLNLKCEGTCAWEGGGGGYTRENTVSARKALNLDVEFICRVYLIDNKTAKPV